MNPEDHWSHDLVNWLKETFPIDLAGRQVYLIDQHEAGPGFSIPRAIAWTGWGLDRRLKDRLEELGLWRGNGFVCVAQSGFSRAWNTERGILVHEMAHWIEEQSKPADDEILLRCMVADLRRIMAATGQAIESPKSPAVEPPRWDGHGDDFTRAILHLAHRSGMRADQMQAAGPYYGMSRIEDYEVALGDEPTRLVSLPVAEILKTPAPEAFIRLWASDIGLNSNEEK